MYEDYITIPAHNTYLFLISQLKKKDKERNKLHHLKNTSLELERIKARILFIITKKKHYIFLTTGIIKILSA